MKIGLIDVDGHNWPNLALMKISAWHKAQGDTVEWWWGFGEYDRVYMSKVFDETYSLDTPEPLNAREIIKGGTGYGLDNRLPDEVEHIYPDYSLYPELTRETAYGFLTSGGGDRRKSSCWTLICWPAGSTWTCWDSLRRAAHGWTSPKGWTAVC